MAKTKPNKSDFVRSLPPDMPAADVVAKAKEAGMTITKGLVYVVRSSRAGKAGAKKGKRAKKGGKMSASEFIRAQAASMNARQVAEEGTKAGYAFKPGLVYTVRRAQEMRAKKSGASSGAPAAKKAAPAFAAPSSGSSSRSELRTLMIRIGLENFETLSASLLRELSKA